MTGREWLDDMSVDELSRFMTDGLRYDYYDEAFDEPVQYNINIDNIKRSYTHSQLGVRDWLEKEIPYDFSKMRRII